MPGGPDCPLDSSSRFPLSSRAQIVGQRPRSAYFDAAVTGAGDISPSVLAEMIAALRRDLHT